MNPSERDIIKKAAEKLSLSIAFWRVSMFSTLLTPAHSHFQWLFGPVGSLGTDSRHHAATTSNFGRRTRLQAAIASVNCQSTVDSRRWRALRMPATFLAQLKASSIRLRIRKLMA